MNADRNNKKLDELILKTIGRDKPQFDFNKWKQNHEKEIDIFESQENSKKQLRLYLSRIYGGLCCGTKLAA